VDVPEIDCVMFADPKTSKIDIVQACGRALRLSDGKTQGYIIVPCVVSDGTTVEQVRQSVAFQFVLDVICALAAQDERIIEEFRAVSQGKQFGSRPIVSFNLNEVVAENISTENFVRAIELECWNKLARLAWRPFEEARKFARSLDLQDVEEWIAYTHGKFPKKQKRPLDIPLSPATVYTKEWQGWRDWLGTDFWPFEQAREFARTLGLRTIVNWREYIKGRFPKLPARPEKVPVHPETVYAKTGWNGYGDWLGSGHIAFANRRVRPFSEARAFARNLGLRSRSEWETFVEGTLESGVKRPLDIPKRPDQSYKKRGWQGWGDWLNCTCVEPTVKKQREAQNRFLPYHEAREIVGRLGFKRGLDWLKWTRGETPELGPFPKNLPKNPSVSYGDDFIGWGDFLGSGNIAPRNKWKVYFPFEKAREFARSLGFSTKADWERYRKGEFPDKPALPKGVPTHPKSIYRRFWIDWQDWLGAPDARSKWQPFEQARTWARTLGLRTAREWFAYCDGKMPDKPPRPSDIPKDVYGAYAKKGWQGIHDWLGVA
jgi:hypothetical protein